MITFVVYKLSKKNIKIFVTCDIVLKLLLDLFHRVIKATEEKLDKM